MLTAEVGVLAVGNMKVSFFMRLKFEFQRLKKGTLTINN